MSIIFIYTTFPSKDSAESISAQLLREKYIACYNLFPISSGFWWQGDIQSEDEYVAVMKSTDDKISDLEQKFLELHPYDVPCFLYWPINGSNSYKAWIEASLK